MVSFSDRNFSEPAIAGFTPEVRENMRTFAKGLANAEGVLRG